jgi:hypothetical protein
MLPCWESRRIAICVCKDNGRAEDLYLSGVRCVSLTRHVMRVRRVPLARHSRASHGMGAPPDAPCQPNAQPLVDHYCR